MRQTFRFGDAVDKRELDGAGWPIALFAQMATADDCQEGGDTLTTPLFAHVSSSQCAASLGTGITPTHANTPNLARPQVSHQLKSNKSGATPHGSAAQPKTVICANNSASGSIQPTPAALSFRPRWPGLKPLSHQSNFLSNWKYSKVCHISRLNYQK